MTSNAIPLQLLIEAAEFALSRTTVRPPDMCEQLLVDRETVGELLVLLSRWGIVTGLNGTAPRLVLLIPAHSAEVVGTLTEYGGVPPLRNPLVALAHPGMTDRGREVLDLLAEGYSNPEIGKRIGLSASTVNGHVDILCQAFHARNRTHLVAVAYRHGLLPNPHSQSTKDIHA